MNYLNLYHQAYVEGEITTALPSAQKKDCLHLGSFRESTLQCVNFRCKICIFVRVSIINIFLFTSFGCVGKSGYNPTRGWGVFGAG